jgi:hypothetical protein
MMKINSSNRRFAPKAIFVFTLSLVVLAACGVPGSTGDSGVAAGPAERALDEAERLAAAGKYAEALERHLYFHHHVLEEAPSMYGIRLSFALSSWVELGAVYPPALVALRDLRDEHARALLAGDTDRERFVDLAAINESLEEIPATVALFKELDAKHPEAAASVAQIVLGALVDAGEFALARRHLKDPRARFDRAVRHYKDGMERVHQKGLDQSTVDVYRSIFADQTAQVILLLHKTGDTELARTLQAEALALVDDAQIRDALPR